MEIKSVDFTTTLQGWKDFRDGNVWKDMQSEFGEWLSDIGTQLEDRNHDERILRVLQGNAETLRNVLNFIDVIIEMNEEAVEFPELDNEENED